MGAKSSRNHPQDESRYDEGPASGANERVKSVERSGKPIVIITPVSRPVELGKTIGVILRRHGLACKSIPENDHKALQHAVQAESANWRSNPKQLPHRVKAWLVREGLLSKTIQALFSDPLDTLPKSAPTQMFKAHSSSIRALAINKSGTRIISGSGDKSVKIWDWPSLNLIARHHDYNAAINALALTPDDRLCIIGTFDGETHVWNWSPGDHGAPRLASRSEVDSINPLPNRWMIWQQIKKILTTPLFTSTQPINVPLDSGAVTKMRPNAPIWCCDVTPNGNFGIVGSSDGHLSIWDLHTQQCSHHIVSSSECIWSCIALDNEHAITGTDTGTLNTWQIHERRLVQSVILRERKPITTLALHPDKRRLIVGFNDGALRLLDLQSGNTRWEGIESGMITSCVITKDGRWLMSCSADPDLNKCLLISWDMETGRVLGRQPQGGPAWSMIILPNESEVMVGSDDGVLRQWPIQVLNTTTVTWTNGIVVDKPENQPAQCYGLNSGSPVSDPLPGTEVVNELEPVLGSNDIITGSPNEVQVWNAETGHRKSVHLSGDTMMVRVRERTQPPLTPDPQHPDSRVTHLLLHPLEIIGFDDSISAESRKISTLLPQQNLNPLPQQNLKLKILIDGVDSDTSFLKRLSTHLAILSKDLDLWDRKRLEQDNFPNDFDVIVVLFSADYLASTISGHRKDVVQAYQSGTKILQLRVRQCALDLSEWTPIAKLEPIVQNQTIASMSSVEQDDICVKIVRMLDQWISEKKSSTTIPSP